MGRTLIVRCGCAAVLGLAGSLAQASPPGSDSARIIYGNAGHGALIVTPAAAPAERVPDSGAPTVLIVDNQVVAPAAVVDRDLALQPTYNGLATLQIADVTTIFDPYADYRRHDVPAGIDSNHSLIKAQREYLALHTGGPARIIWGSALKPIVAAAAQPVMMLITPFLPPHNTTPPVPAPIPSPPPEAAPAHPAVPAQTPSAPGPAQPEIQTAAAQ